MSDPQLPAIQTVETPFGSIQGTPDFEMAMALGGLDYEVEQVSVRASDDLERDIPGYKIIRRADNPQVVFNIPTEGYLIVQNREVMEFAHPVVEAAEGIYSRVGFLDKGASIFAFAELPEKIVIAEGEEMTPHMVIRSSHDGSASVSISFLATLNHRRHSMIPCASGVRSFVSYRHTKNTSLRMSEVQRLLEMKNTFFRKLREDSLELVGSEMTEAEAESFVHKMLEFPTEIDVAVHPKKQQMRDQIMEAFRSVTEDSLSNTRYAMLLAFSYYRTHEAPTRTKSGTPEAREEARFSSVLSGTSKEEINRVFQELLAGRSKSQ